MKGWEIVKQEKPSLTKLREFLRYFGFAIFSVGVVLIAFIGINRQVRSEIRTGTYQTLLDAARYQRTAIEKYAHLVTTRAKLIADHERSSSASELVDALQLELQRDAKNVKAGFADTEGNVLYGDLSSAKVSSEEWFQRSMLGETLITVMMADSAISLLAKNLVPRLHDIPSASIFVCSGRRTSTASFSLMMNSLTSAIESAGRSDTIKLHGYNYEKGICATIEFEWDNDDKTLTIDERKGTFPGMLQSRVFNIVLVSENNGVGLPITKNVSKTITYKGSEVTVKLAK